MMQDQTVVKVKGFALTKVTAIILVITFVLSLGFMITGVVLLNADNTDDSLSNAPSTDGTILLTAGVLKTVPCASGEELTFKFTASSSKEYEICVNGGEIESVAMGYRTLMPSYGTASAYDDYAKINLSSGKVYTITISSTSGSVQIKVS